MTRDENSDHAPETHPSLGLARGTVELVEYDPAWREAYESEVARLRPRLGESVLGFEHVGSTSVPGLAAKPIVDMLVLVSDLDATEDVARVLSDAGYEERPNDDVPDRRFFARGPPSCRTHYLSVTERGSDCHREQVAFRDALRGNRPLAAAYEELKRGLASVHPDDRDVYTEAKSSFVQSVLDGTDAVADE
ncbi:GrpB family protein [Haloferax larsenii]|uniref:GrpB family protein n=1 Tax=Haloferax larsenii TaxID=302484 RepID=A0ABY5RBF4_HALLR|nr:GrpB family protein [Haloferax larsenii]ELZ74311.1 Glutamate-rich protein grpB [Haloferax larsenii JCM 13917]UVE48930.1 GrpB family protein [Haloferax larsenii]